MIPKMTLREVRIKPGVVERYGHCLLCEKKVILPESCVFVECSVCGEHYDSDGMQIDQEEARKLADADRLALEEFNKEERLRGQAKSVLSSIPAIGLLGKR